MAKDRLRCGKEYLKACLNKKGSGATTSPRTVSRLAQRLGVLSRSDESGGQNLAALGTTAGQNLAAVGGSHSLAEAMNLGAMTLSGLVGTLHVFTPPVNTS